MKPKNTLSVTTVTGACEVALCHGMGVLGSEESSLWLNPQGELARRRGGHRETGIYLAYIPSEASGMCSVLLFFPRVENRTQIAHGGRLSGTPPPTPLPACVKSFSPSTIAGAGW